ncbi:MAG: stage II sporulation protein R [Oscillibacter sp.]|jgi:stage II sporulation protein R|nr:stage II sporulation protein R [Oscillibacter sp.]
MKRLDCRKLKLLEIALMLGAALFLTSGALALQTGDQLAEKVVRLHVIANSDSDADQALKLQVRDRVLERAEALLRQCESRQDAEKLLESRLFELRRIALEEIRDNGFDYDAVVRLTEMDFPTREYDSFTLPAGKYLALRVVIGEGAGRNWWCVVFPPLCAAASADVPASALAAGLSEEQVGLITESDGYIIKSKLVEFWEQLRNNAE